MDKLKACVAVATLTEEITKEIEKLKEECKDHVEIVVLDKSKDTYQEQLDEILNSQILLAYFDSDKDNYGIGCEVSVFASSLETLRRLGMSHSPKLLIGQTRSITGESMVLGFLGAFGVLTTHIDATLDAIINFYNEYPF